MNILIISYGVTEPGAGLVKEDTLQQVRFESEYYRHNDPTRAFPEYAVSELLREHNIGLEDIDHIAFYGKPFSCLERLIHLHIFLFPGYFFRFISDFRDYFTGKFRIPAKLTKELGVKRPVCYPDPMHAISVGMKDKGDLIISLRNTINSRTIGLYRTDNGRPVLSKELLYPNCLSYFSSINTARVEKIPPGSGCPVRIFDDGSFCLKKSFFRYHNGTVFLKNELSSKGAETIFENILSRMVNSLVTGPGDTPVTFVSDYIVQDTVVKRLKCKFKNLEILTLDNTDVMKYIASYTVNALKEI